MSFKWSIGAGGLVAVAAVAAFAVEGTAAKGPGAFVNAHRLVQAFGTPDAATPAADAPLKAALYKAVGKDGVLTAQELKGFVTPDVFEKLAGTDGLLEPAEAARALEADVPASRKNLRPRVREHLDGLATSLDRIEESKREACRSLAAWIADRHATGRPVPIILICTGNTRRSILGSTMGNLAADYCGLPEVRFYCGGTAPTSINPRSIASLKAIGVEIEPTGKEAKRGEPETVNPIHRVSWGVDGGESSRCLEFSKRYDDGSNPSKEFAALMVCSEADEGCPVVKGASIRLSIPYMDPKIFDDSPYEAEKYAERRDDEGRFMLAALVEARLRIKAAANK